MSWTALTYAFGSLLTSTKMTWLYNNVDFVREGIYNTYTTAGTLDLGTQSFVSSGDVVLTGGALTTTGGAVTVNSNDVTLNGGDLILTTGNVVGGTVSPGRAYYVGTLTTSTWITMSGVDATGINWIDKRIVAFITNTASAEWIGDGSPQMASGVLTEGTTRNLIDNTSIIFDIQAANTTGDLQVRGVNSDWATIIVYMVD